MDSKKVVKRTSKAVDDIGANSSKYIPRVADGNPKSLARHKVGTQDIPLPDPKASGPHTTLGGKTSKTGKAYRQSARFGEGAFPPANGQNVPWSEVHWYDHGRGDHADVHQHIFDYDWTNGSWKRGGPTPFL